jgi:hypothetical protein
LAQNVGISANIGGVVENGIAKQDDVYHWTPASEQEANSRVRLEMFAGVSGPAMIPDLYRAASCYTP